MPHTEHTQRTGYTLHCAGDRFPRTVCAVRRPEPPYRLVSAAVRDRIDAGEWLPGEQLPTVRELAGEYDVSIATIRKAVALLRNQGLLTVQPGWGIFRSS
jgi:DNA-binding GntR family transcriptional regulator